MTHLGKLQRKIRFQQWKYVLIALVMCVAGISVTLFGTLTSPNQTTVVFDSSTPSAVLTPSAPPLDFFDILIELDQRRITAFENRDVKMLAMVNEPGSLQFARDKQSLQSIIDQNLTLEFPEVSIISVVPISLISEDSTHALLEVKDVAGTNERLWRIELKRQPDGAWLYSQITLVQP